MDNKSDKLIKEFLVKYPVKSIDKKQIILFPDEEPKGLYYLISGRVRQYDINEQGDEVVLFLNKPGDFFPMTWAIGQIDNEYFFETSTSIDIKIIPQSDINFFLKNNPDVLYDLLGRIYTNISYMERRIVHLMGGNSHSRIIFELINACKEFGQKQKDGSYLLHMHEEELAHIVGLSRETVSRELSKLKQLKIMDINHTDLIVTDLDVLENELGSKL